MWPMHNCRVLQTLGVLACLVATSASLHSQSIVIHFVNGKSGRPIPNARLLVFLSNERGSHENSTAVATNDDGRALLDVKAYRYMMIFPDWLSSCVSDPNSMALPAEAVQKQGFSAENNCSKKVRVEAKPNGLIFYGREATLREKMTW